MPLISDFRIRHRFLFNTSALLLVLGCRTDNKFNTHMADATDPGFWLFYGHSSNIVKYERPVTSGYCLELSSPSSYLL